MDDIRERWGMKGDPGDPPLSSAEVLDRAAPYVCDHDYCDLEECTCKCHKDTADAAVREIAVREIMTSTDKPLSPYGLIRRQHHLVCELRERVNELLTALNTTHADYLEAVKANGEWAKRELVLKIDLDAAVDRLMAMCRNGWRCYASPQLVGEVTKWYVRDWNNRLTDGWDSPQQAIDSAINRAQELRQIPSGGGNVQL